MRLYYFLCASCYTEFQSPRPWALCPNCQTTRATVLLRDSESEIDRSVLPGSEPTVSDVDVNG